MSKNRHIKASLKSIGLVNIFGAKDWSVKQKTIPLNFLVMILTLRLVSFLISTEYKLIICSELMERKSPKALTYAQRI
jgi:hypothetical protein